MPNLKAKFSFINRLFNVKDTEWPRISIAWLMRVIFRIGFVVLWTIVIAIFVGFFGISTLPYLFVLTAAFKIMGTFFYSSLLESYSKKVIMLITIILTSILLLSAVLLKSQSEALFFSILLIIVAINLSQLRIFLLGFVESLFNPIESERTFPLIESAETIGGIVGGVLIVTVANNFGYIPLVYFCSILFLILAPCLFLAYGFLKKIKSFNTYSNTKIQIKGFINKLNYAFSDSKHAPYLKGLFTIVFLYWLLFNLMEFTYTKAIYNTTNDVVLSGGAGFKNVFISQLGYVFIIFSSAAFLLQIFFASRLINYLGVVGSMLLHPLLFLLSLISLFFSFSYPTAVLMKTNYTVTSVVHHDAYHSSYYAIKHNLRTYMHELGEGLIRPLGAIFGTLILIILHAIFSGAGLVHSITLSMIILTFVLIFVTHTLQKKYTMVALQDLKFGKTISERINAIDILSQKGHKDSSGLLKSILRDNAEPLSVRLRVLNAFRSLKDSKYVDDILECLNSSHRVIKENTLDTLFSYRCLLKNHKKSHLIQSKVVTALKVFYKKESSHTLRSKVINILSKFSPVITLDFLTEILKDSDEKLKADAILALGSLNNNTIHQKIVPFLSSTNSELRISAAIALGNDVNYRKMITDIIKEYVKSDSIELQKLGVYAIGELKMVSLSKYCFKKLGAKDDELRAEAALSLMKLDKEDSIEHIVDMLLNEGNNISKYVQRKLSTMTGRLTDRLDKILKIHVSDKISDLFSDSDLIEDFEEDQLVHLKRLYCLVGQYNEVEQINRIIKQESYY